MLGRKIHLRLLAADHRDPAGGHGRQSEYYGRHRLDAAHNYASIPRIPFGAFLRQFRGYKHSGGIFRSVYAIRRDLATHAHVGPLLQQLLRCARRGGERAGVRRNPFPNRLSRWTSARSERGELRSATRTPSVAPDTVGRRLRETAVSPCPDIEDTGRGLRSRLAGVPAVESMMRGCPPLEPQTVSSSRLQSL